jgi:hypothetical protein
MARGKVKFCLRYCIWKMLDSETMLFWIESEKRSDEMGVGMSDVAPVDQSSAGVNSPNRYSTLSSLPGKTVVMSTRPRMSSAKAA